MSDNPIPEGLHEIVFDVERARRDFPDMERQPAAFVAALSDQNPATPWPLLCIMAREILMVQAVPDPGKEQAFTDALAWLEKEGAGLKVADGTLGGEWDAKKQENLNRWRQ